MGLIQEIQQINNRQTRQEQEKQKRLEEIKEINKIQKRQQEHKQYIKDLKISVKNDLYNIFYEEYKNKGLNCKYYFYNIEIREKTIQNIIKEYEEENSSLYDFLSSNYDKILVSVDNIYKKSQLSKDFENIQKTKLINLLNIIKEQKQQEEIKQQQAENQKQQEKQKQKNIIFNLLQYIFSFPSIILILIITFIILAYTAN